MNEDPPQFAMHSHRQLTAFVTCKFTDEEILSNLPLLRADAAYCDALILLVLYCRYLFCSFSREFIPHLLLIIVLVRCSKA